MEESFTKEELLNFKKKLILEYDYYLDLYDLIEIIEESGTIDDYTKAIEQYNKFKSKYTVIKIAAYTGSSVIIGGLFALLGVIVPELQSKTLLPRIIMGVSFGLAGCNYITNGCFSKEEYINLITNNSIAELKKKRESILSEIGILFNKGTEINVELEKSNLLSNIEMLAQVYSYIEELEQSIIEKYYSTNIEGIIYGEEQLTKVQNAENELKYGYSLVKTYLH